MALQGVEHRAPQRRLLGGLNLRQVEHDRRSLLLQAAVVAGDVEHRIDDGGRKPGAAGLAHVAVVEVQPAGAEDLGGEPQLRRPVVDDGAPEKALPPGVHAGGHLLGGGQEHVVAGDRQPQVALVVERHGGDLAERVLAVEHPAVGARQQRVRGVADAAVYRRIGLGGGAGALDPLPLQIVRNLAAGEIAVARRLHANVRPSDGCAGIEEADPLPFPRAPRTPLDALAHQPPALFVEPGQGVQRVEHLGRVDIVILALQLGADFQGRGRLAHTALESTELAGSRTSSPSDGRPRPGSDEAAAKMHPRLAALRSVPRRPPARRLRAERQQRTGGATSGPPAAQPIRGRGAFCDEQSRAD